MSVNLQPPLRPKFGLMLLVVIIVRISTVHQDLRSLADQEAKCREYLRLHYGENVEVILLSSQGSGEHLDREELNQLESLIEAGKIDLVLAEDLARICRRQRAYDFCEMCLDHGVRLIAINDRIDTSVENWQDSAFLATWHHERSNRDTSSRIKRSLNSRFDRGELIQSLPYGYLKPANAKTDSDIEKDPAAEPVLKEIFRRLEGGANYSEIADWLKEAKVPPGPNCRSDIWKCKMVSRLVHNPILKGVRVRNRMVTKRVNKTGRHRSVKGTPDQLRKRECPHLAFFDPAYYDHIIRQLDERNAMFVRAKPGAVDSRKGTPRKQTRWPGQHARCGICGRLMYWTRDGKAPAMICSGAQDYRCWNSQIIPGDRYMSKLVTAILASFQTLPGFDPVILRQVQERIQSAGNERGSHIEATEQQLNAVTRKLRSIVDAVETQSGSRSLLERLGQLESEQSELEYKLQQLRKRPATNIIVPSQEELLSTTTSLFERVATEDQEAGRLLRQLIPDFFVVPCRTCDDGAIVSRAHLTLHLCSLLPAEARQPETDEILIRPLIVDLFDPPQRIAFRERVLTLRESGLTERAAADQLGITKTAAQHAMRLHRKMQEDGLTDPYLRLHEVPEKSKFTRHLHPRFCFEPLPGFPLS